MQASTQCAQSASWIIINLPQPTFIFPWIDRQINYFEKNKETASVLAYLIQRKNVNICHVYIFLRNNNSMTFLECLLITFAMLVRDMPLTGCEKRGKQVRSNLPWRLLGIHLYHVYNVLYFSFLVILENKESDYYISALLIALALN